MLSLPTCGRLLGCRAREVLRTSTSAPLEASRSASSIERAVIASCTSASASAWASADAASDCSWRGMIASLRSATSAEMSGTATCAASTASCTCPAEPRRTLGCKSRLGPSRLGPSRLGPSRLGPSRLGPSGLGPSRLAAPLGYSPSVRQRLYRKPMAVRDAVAQQGWAQSRCRCGRGEPSPASDVGGLGPFLGRMWQGEPSPGEDLAGVAPFIPGADVGGMCELRKAAGERPSY